MSVIHAVLTIVCSVLVVSALAAPLILSQRRQLDRWRYEARHDHLTGLPNRRALTEHLTAQLRAGAPVSVALLDLDGFKQINDAYGHAAGDQVLVEVADRLRALAGFTSMVARLGGDEFAAAIPSTHPGAVRRIGEAVCHLVTGSPVHLAPARHPELGVSVGLASATENATAPLLLHHADAAMYIAKTDGGGVHSYHASDSQASPEAVPDRPVVRLRDQHRAAPADRTGR